MENLDLGSKIPLYTNFNKNKYLSFSHFNDETFTGVLKEGAQKLEYITSLCTNRNLCIQAGCNCGIFPDYLSENFKSVITLEPIEENISHAIKNLSIKQNIELIHGGLGKKPGFCSPSFNKRNCGASKIILDKNGNVPLFTIDQIILDMNQHKHCDLIYLDIEGDEYNAILGGLKTIEKFKPILVLENKGLIPEFPSNLNGSQALREFISSLGYVHKKRILRDDIFVPQS